MQQGGGSQYGVSPEMAPFAAAATTATAAATATSTRTIVLGGVAAAATDHHQLKLGDPALPVAEEASPISSRPPAHSSAVNFDELLPVGGGRLPDEDALAAAADEGDRGGVAGGNRWPRQETLALLKIRSEMDVAFRDATLKGPLWEDVSRKLAELGYTRSAKKCKEKFENVHKYYKRTKEGRAGRQDGKSYRFFTQLEALHNTAPSNVSPAPVTPLTTVTAPPSTNTTTATSTVSPPTNLLVAAAPVSIGIVSSSNPIPVPSVRIPPAMGASPMFPPDLSSGMISAPPGSAAATAPATAPTALAALGISFSSNTSSSSSGTDDDEPEDEEIFQGEPSIADSGRFLRKRKRGSSGGSSNSRRMMDFFESLMKQVMEKQEVMQQRFLETIEKREQDRMIREEAWKRQEMARLSREHDLMAQERALSASRDAAIIAFLQKITGQTIQLPTPVTIPAAPPPPVPSPVPPPAPPTQHHHHHQPQAQQQQPQPQQQQHHHHQHHHQQQQQTHHIHHQQHQSQSTQVVVRHQPSISSEVVMAIPEQQVPPQEMSSGGGLESSSSRWPKAEVLALIKLRSGLDSRYQEAGPKGPLWEEISAGMMQMGYKRSAKRCKEKWENINKYFKKVKESNKKRPEDAKTCPYFHQLDALYRQKLLGSTSGSGGSASGSYINPNRPEEQQQQQPPQPPPQLEGAKLDPIPTPYSQDRGEVPPAIIPPQVTTSQGAESESKNGASSDEQTNNGGLPGSLFGEGSSTPKKPEDIVKDKQVVMEDYDNEEELDSDNMDQEEEDEEEDDEEGDEESEEERKIGYKIEFQRQNAGSSNGGGNGTTPSFLAVVQ